MIIKYKNKDIELEIRNKNEMTAKEVFELARTLLIVDTTPSGPITQGIFNPTNVLEKAPNGAVDSNLASMEKDRLPNLIAGGIAKHLLCPECHQGLAFKKEGVVIICDAKGGNEFHTLLKGRFSGTFEELLDIMYGKRNQELANYIDQTKVEVSSDDTAVTTCLKCSYDGHLSDFAMFGELNYESFCKLCGSEVVFETSENGTKVVCESEECDYEREIGTELKESQS